MFFVKISLDKARSNYEINSLEKRKMLSHWKSSNSNGYIFDEEYVGGIKAKCELKNNYLNKKLREWEKVANISIKIRITGGQWRPSN